MTIKKNSNPLSPLPQLSSFHLLLSCLVFKKPGFLKTSFPSAWEILKIQRSRQRIFRISQKKESRSKAPQALLAGPVKQSSHRPMECRGNNQNEAEAIPSFSIFSCPVLFSKSLAF
jgi:hypothetical protein